MPYQSNTPWALDEWILSLEIYLKHKDLSYKEQIKVLEEHSKMRQHLGVLLGHDPAKQEKYRNSVGLWRNQQQFVKIEKGERKDKRVSKGARLAWDLLHKHPASLRTACDAIYASLHPFIGNTHRRDGVLFPSEDNLSSLHPEGFYLTHLHLAYDKPLLRAVVSGRKMKEEKQDFVLCDDCEKEHGGREINRMHCHYSDKEQINLLVDRKFDHRKYSLYCGDCHEKIHEQKPWINLRFQQLTL